MACRRNNVYFTYTKHSSLAAYTTPASVVSDVSYCCDCIHSLWECLECLSKEHNDSGTSSLTVQL